jgi:hypothetical protein
MTTEPSILRQYGLGTSIIWPMEPIGSFFLELLPATTAPPSALFSTLIPQLHHNQTEIIVVEVKDIRQTVAIETGFGEMNAWLEIFCLHFK